MRRVTPEEVRRGRRSVVAADVRSAAADIVDDVRTRGVDAVRELALKFGERGVSDALVLERSAMRRALDAASPDDRAVLERTADRIRAFASAQLAAISDVCIDVPGGQAGHTIEPVDSAACYAPAGRSPLISSALMTAVTARVAGCGRVVLASPGAHPLILAAAALADVDEVLAVGGAHAIGALAFGFEGFKPCDVIVGPGNAWVTGAKLAVQGCVGVDLAAGPSELLVLADDGADPDLIAADLLAQAEHDVDALAMLVTTSATLANRVSAAVEQRLDDLPTADVARRSLEQGFACVVRDERELIEVANGLAAEHVQVMTRDPQRTAAGIRSAGAIFLGPRSAEVLGDYGAGPNHTLPTGGTARFSAGLSVMHFLRLRTWLRIDETDRELVHDAARLADLEGLPGHAAAARERLKAGFVVR